MRRRGLLLRFAGLSMAGAAYRYWPEDGFRNPCLLDPLPKNLRKHDLVHSAWEGIDPARVWDCHTHLIGTGDSGSGLWVNPQMQSLRNPIQWLQRSFYLNAYAASLAQAHPDRFEWVDPYREDAVEALQDAKSNGARAVKWHPPAQGMDPASPLCDPFYQAATGLDMPLLVHAGPELAVHGGNMEDFGNPLRLRRPLEHGVRIMVAQCVPLGQGPDLDVGPGLPGAFF